MDPIGAFERGYREGRIVFFVGAGASRESGAPMPDQVLRASAELFLPRDPRADLVVPPSGVPHGGEPRGIQPEIFYEHALLVADTIEALHPWRILSRRWLEGRGARLAPNRNHLALAAYARRTGLPVFTTNFDTLIEDAARELAHPSIDVVVAFSRDEARAVARQLKPHHDRPRAALFKLHGSIELGDAEALWTLKATMEGITAINRSALRLMRHLADGHRFAFIGYSGSDIDYFPVLAGMRLREPPFWFNPGRDPVTGEHARRIGASEIDAFPSEVFGALHPEFREITESVWPDCSRLLDSLLAEAPVRLRSCQKKLLLGMCLNSVGRNTEARAVLAELCAHDGGTPWRDRVYALLHLARAEDCLSRYERSAETAERAIAAIAEARRVGAIAAAEARAARVRALYQRAMARQQQIGPSIRYGAVRWRPRRRDMLARLFSGIALQARFCWARALLRRSRPRGFRGQPRLAHARAEHAMNDHLMMLFGRVVSLLEVTGLAGVPGLRRLLALATGAIRGGAWKCGDYFVYAGAEKYRQRLLGQGSCDAAGDTYTLLRDPLNRALVLRDQAARLLERGDMDAAARRFRMAADAAMESGSAATAIKALVGLRACGAASPADEEDLGELSAQVEGDGYRRFRDWLARD